jgi:hypothetical protein
MPVGRVIAMQLALRLCIGAEPVVRRSSRLGQLLEVCEHGAPLFALRGRRRSGQSGDTDTVSEAVQSAFWFGASHLGHQYALARVAQRHAVAPERLSVVIRRGPAIPDTLGSRSVERAPSLHISHISHILHSQLYLTALQCRSPRPSCSVSSRPQLRL